MEWEIFNKAIAETIYEKIENGERYPLTPFYQNLKLELMRIFKETKEELGIQDEIKNRYEFDCILALKLYNLLNTQYNMNEKQATNDGMWRFIQLAVVPEIIIERWGMNTQRFYEKGNRMYLKILWWYCHLSWNENQMKTRDILLSSVNNTDTIAQLVERIGEYGYRIELYREIMKKKHEVQLSHDEFRKLMVLNNARVKVINPYLLNGGVVEYVDMLINDVRG